MLKTYWVLECVNMLCSPPAELRRMWAVKDECRAAVVRAMGSMPAEKRFTWRCTAVQRAADAPPDLHPYTWEPHPLTLERDR